MKLLIAIVSDEDSNILSDKLNREGFEQQSSVPPAA